MTAPSARSLGIATRRERIAMEGGMRCYYCRCGLTMAQGCVNSATVDHMQPKCRGGTSRRSNLVAACHGCNQRKSNMSAGEYLAVFGGRPPSRHPEKDARREARQAAIACAERWARRDRAGYRASDMGLDSPPMIGLAAVWPGQDGRVG